MTEILEILNSGLTGTLEDYVNDRLNDFGLRKLPEEDDDWNDLIWGIFNDVDSRMEEYYEYDITGKETCIILKYIKNHFGYIPETFDMPSLISLASIAFCLENFDIFNNWVNAWADDNIDEDSEDSEDDETTDDMINRVMRENPDLYPQEPMDYTGCIASPAA